MPLDSPAAVVEALRGRPILTPDLFAELEKLHAPAHKSASDLARHLIRLKWLTLYQAKKILSGHANDLVIGNYVVQDKLGEGGMGKVYRAVQLNLNRVVALKVVRSSLLKNEVTLKRFRREVKAAAALSHPNIVRVFDADQVNGRHFLAMEFIEGKDLGVLVREHGRLPVSVACSFVRQAALGLQHAHDQGFVHRDIKPSNLLVATNENGQYGPKNNVKILDMGLAREQQFDGADNLSTELTRAGTVVGTPDYMSPEQAKNSSGVDHRSDLYALGCTFYYLLIGEVVFPNGNPLEKLLSHQMDNPRPVQLIRMDAPHEVASIIQCLLAKRPEQRFQSGNALANALEPWCTSKGASTIQPAVVLQAEAVDPVTTTINPSQGNAPFDFGELNDDDEFDTTRMTPPNTDPETAVRPTPKPALSPKLWLYFVPAALLFIGLILALIIALSKGRDPQTEPTPNDPATKSELPKQKTDSKAAPVVKDLDTIEKYLPNDTAVMVVLEAKGFQVPQIQAGLIQPITKKLLEFKTATGVDLMTTVDRMIVAYPDADKGSPLVILQGKTLVTDRLLEGVKALKAVQIEKVFNDKAEIATIPWVDGTPMYAAVSDASIFLSMQQSRVMDAVEKREGIKKTKLNDPTIDTAIRMMYSKLLNPKATTSNAMFVALGLRSPGISAFPSSARLNFAAATLHFDERGMHFHTVSDEMESGKGAEFQRTLANTLLDKATANTPESVRFQRFGELLAKSLDTPQPKGKYYHTHTRLAYEQIKEWLFPFLPLEIQD